MSPGQFMIININNPPFGYRSGTPRMSLLKEPCGRNGKDVNFQIHNMEKEAYCSVLRAFIAQSDLLSWGKEGLITDLRKELNVTDIEHGQLLMKINSDESIKRIREWRKGAHESLSAKVDSPGLITDPMDYTPPKKRRPSYPSLSISRKHVPHDHPNSESVPSLAQAHFRNNQQHVELAVFPSEQSMNVVNHNFHSPLGNRGGLDQFHQKKDFHIPDSCKLKNCSDFIQIRATDMVIHEVERMACRRKNPDLAEVEKAKSILREHERAILEALDKLADVSDEDDSLDHPYNFNEELHGKRNSTLASRDFHGQVGSRFH